MIIRNRISVLILVALFFAFSTEAQANDNEVRGTIQRVFEQLKSRDYGSVYEALPASSKTRMSRARFVSALSRAQDFYVLERIEVGKVRVSGNLAVVDTVLYGKVLFPSQTDGKIVAQQYLVQENGQWKVATGDNRTIRNFLSGNPAFGRKFPIREPQIYVKQNGSWVAFKPPRSLLR